MAAVEIIGGEFVKDQLGRFMPREAKAILRRTVVKFAAEIRNDIRKRAPVNTGNLRKAIVSKRDRGTKTSVEASVWATHGQNAKRQAHYWHVVEFGSVDNRPRPFITPAVARAQNAFKIDFRRIFLDQLAKQMEKRAKRQQVPK